MWTDKRTCLNGSKPPSGECKLWRSDEIISFFAFGHTHTHKAKLIHRRYAGCNNVTSCLTSSQTAESWVTPDSSRCFTKSTTSWLDITFLTRQQTPAELSWNSTGPTRTSSATSARGSSRGCRRVRRLPRSACHEPDTHDDPRQLVRHARFSSRGCPLGMRECTRVNVFMYTFTKLYNRCIPNVGVCVGPVEFQLYDPIELEQILVLILNHIRFTVDWIGAGLFL